LSDAYHIDAKYRSMRGPWGQQGVFLRESPEPELLWITGYQTQVVDAATDEALSQEFMCHANLDLDPFEYRSDFDLQHAVSARVFTLSQGQDQITFPVGFGIPILSTEVLTLTTQVLNLNVEEPDMRVRQKVTIDFVRDNDVTEPMKPLFLGAVQGFKSLEGDGLVYGIADPDMEAHGAGCAVGSSAIENDIDRDAHGREFTAHWVVEPGREVTNTLVTEFLELELDTTVHYIAVHLHPFAESLELFDRTSGESVFRAEVQGSTDRIGIERVPFFSSVEGKALASDHEYELVSVYDNTSGEEQDSMAVMYLYLHDPTWEKPDLTRVAVAPMESARDATAEGPPRM
ncbi:MAG: hypothetical protein JRJ84_25945, partial [Deltaproteobacteria bacterium]|nr:hypothetical protein [Deltaproteobacteria bacterium]